MFAQVQLSIPHTSRRLIASMLSFSSITSVLLWVICVWLLFLFNGYNSVYDEVPFHVFENIIDVLRAYRPNTNLKTGIKINSNWKCFPEHDECYANQHKSVYITKMKTKKCVKTKQNQNPQKGHKYT